MTELNRALVDIRNIRRQVAQTTEFRGYGPLTLATTAGIALIAGRAQALWLPQPASHPAQYVALWLTSAILSSALIATQMLMRANRLHSGMADAMVRIAVEQFLPAGLAGAFLPFVLLHATPGVFWMLPGLWQIIFSLGVFASCRGLALGDARALAPAMIAVPFAVGMAAVAAVHLLSAQKASLGEDDVDKVL